MALKRIDYINDALDAVAVAENIKSRRPELRDMYLVSFQQDGNSWRATFQSADIAIGFEGALDRMRRTLAKVESY